MTVIGFVNKVIERGHSDVAQWLYGIGGFEKAIDWNTYQHTNKHFGKAASLPRYGSLRLNIEEDLL
jgi:hypothetical protein